MKKIYVEKSSVADTRTCNPSLVSMGDLMHATMLHINDVRNGIGLLISMLFDSGKKHDETKITHRDDFYRCFSGGFEDKSWWEMHQEKERHHFNDPEKIQDDINLIDVLEQIVDGVMAGMARSGLYRYEPVSDELLQKAYRNTAKLLIDKIVIK